MRALPPAARCNLIWHCIAAWAAGLSGWKYVDPWSPSITVMVPPGLSSLLRITNASTGRARCSKTKQTKMWSNDSALKGKAKMSACRNSTLVSPAEATFRLASAMESADTSTAVKRAPGLRRARVTVWAPTPHPASSTILSGGYSVSKCNKSINVPA